MALAGVAHDEQEPTNEVYNDKSLKALNRRIEGLQKKVSAQLIQQEILEEDIEY